MSSKNIQPNTRPSEVLNSWEIDSVISWFMYYMPMEQRGKLMVTMPQVYDKLVGHPVMAVRPVNEDKVVTFNLSPQPDESTPLEKITWDMLQMEGNGIPGVTSVLLSAGPYPTLRFTHKQDGISREHKWVNKRDKIEKYIYDSQESLWKSVELEIPTPPQPDEVPVIQHEYEPTQVEKITWDMLEKHSKQRDDRDAIPGVSNVAYHSGSTQYHPDREFGFSFRGNRYALRMNKENHSTQLYIFDDGNFNWYPTGVN